MIYAYMCKENRENESENIHYSIQIRSGYGYGAVCVIGKEKRLKKRENRMEIM